ncbi:MAG: serine/threonine-protein kinase, partial [Planctomycetota bacterium]
PPPPEKPKGPILLKSRAQRIKEEEEEASRRRREERKKARAAGDATAETATESTSVDIVDERTLDTVLHAEGGVERLLERGKTLQFGGFAILRRLSEGGMGVVFKASHPKHGVVALKVLRRDMVDEKNIARFKQEAWAISAFDHPAVVKVRDLATVGGMPYIAMEFIDGEDLLAVGFRRELTYWQTAEAIKKIADVLELVHARNIWHRDIKPQNVLRDRSGEIKLIDFGIATIEREHDDATKTGEGLIMGTPAFLSPEQAARGKMGPIDGRADLYSLGAVFYYLLTGRRPFSGRSAVEILHANMTQPPPHPRTVDELIPGGLADICLKLLEKDPAGRFQTAAELKAAIDAWRRSPDGRMEKERHDKILKLRALKARRQKAAAGP